MPENIQPLAHSIDGACAALGVGKTFLYQEAKAGRLKIRKAGSRSIILDTELREYAANLPLAKQAEAPAAA